MNGVSNVKPIIIDVVIFYITFMEGILVASALEQSLCFGEVYQHEKVFRTEKLSDLSIKGQAAFFGARERDKKEKSERLVRE